ncbi:MAG: replicative DNA helicase [Planctomycetota bacterium]|jgi:replicative DNA helicase
MVEASSAPAFAPGEQEGRSMIAKALPHSPELERAILAVLLDGRHAISIQQVRPQLAHCLAFYERNHRIIYQACLDLDDQQQRVDAQGVAEVLRKTGFRVAIDRLRQLERLLESDQLDAMTGDQRKALYRWRDQDAAAGFDDSALAAIGGFAALTDLVGQFSTAAGLERNAELQHEYYAKRRLIQRLSRLIGEAYQTTETFDTLLDHSSQVVLELAQMSDNNSQIYAIDGVVSEVLQDVVNRNSGEIHSVDTGYPQLDDWLMSLRPGGLYILAARPGVGKTSFALSMVQNVCAGAVPKSVLFFSLEVDRRDLLKKMLCGSAGISFMKLERGDLNGPDYQHLEAAADAFREWKLDLMDVSDITVRGVLSVVKRHQLEMQQRGEKLDLVVLDYLQLIKGSHPQQSEYEKVSEISRTLKVLAKELHLPVVALSQMSRDADKAQGKPRDPRLSDLRGSGSIEQDADAVLFLHREHTDDDNGSHKIKLIVAKNRFGPVNKDLPLTFLPAKQKFIPRATEELDTGEVAAASMARGRFEQAPREDEDYFG